MIDPLLQFPFYDDYLLSISRILIRVIYSSFSLCLKRIYESNYPPVSVPSDQSFSRFLLKNNPDDVPVDTTIWADFKDMEHKMTFGGIRESAALGAAGLQKVLGIEGGDFVCIYATNSVKWAYLSHSVMWAGAVFK